MNGIAPLGLLQFEKSILGGVMLRPELLRELDIETADFVDIKHQVVFEAMRNLDHTGTAIDLSTIGGVVEQQGKMDAIGGFAFLGELMLSVPIPENVHEYAKTVRDESLKRQVMITYSEIKTAWERFPTTGKELLDMAMAGLMRIDADQVRDASLYVRDLAREHMRHLEEEARRRQLGMVELTGYPTGVEDLDKLIGGWQPGIVSVVCARPGHGKSSLCLSTALATATKGNGVHVFSMEDPRKIYMNRAYAQLSKVAISKIAVGEFTRDDLSRFTQAHAILAGGKLPWVIDDRSGIAADDIVRSVRRHQAKNKTKLVIVDYLQLMKRSAHGLAKNRHEAIGESLNELADAAKNDNMAYIVVSQLNRGVEGRDDKRPQEADLRESGTIEERAKCIVALYRGRKYGPDPVDGIDLNLDGSRMSNHVFNNTVQLLVLKNSQGPAPERVVANWDGPTTRVW